MASSLRYDPLSDYLKALPDTEITLSFGQIESIIGRPLPPSSSNDNWRQWWANAARHSQAEAWLRAGWEVVSPNPQSRLVRFRRSGRRMADRSKAHLQTAGASSQSFLSGPALALVNEYMAEHSLDHAAALAMIVNETAMSRRKALLTRLRTIGSKSPGGSAADLIREDRDGR
jgi:hypothetical protein